jgi:hypothetical protein
LECIADGKADDAAGAGEDLLRIHAFVGVAGEVFHFAMLPPGEPSLKLRCAFRSFRGREPAGVEAKLECAAPDGIFHRWAASAV